MVKIRNRFVDVRSWCVANPVRWVALSMLPMTATAQMSDVQLSSTFSIDRGVQMIWDDGAIDASFDPAPSILTTASAVSTLTNGARLTYGAALNITGNGIATTNGEGETDGGLSLNYERKFGSAHEWQYQIRGEVDRLLSDGQWVFQRERVGFHLKYRENADQWTAGQIRFGYRDHNDERLAGYDQTEVLGLITHTWMPNSDGIKVAGTLYGETRRADLDRYSYDEAGLRLMTRMPLWDASEITGRFTYYQRDFRDSFSTTDPTRRADTRLKAVVEVGHEFSDRLTGNIYAGWDENASTIAKMDYNGTIAGVGITYQWR